MKIISMYATFGKLLNSELHLVDGLNIIYGGNESGKSTWSAFIRAMLFGISTRERSTSGFMADKDKYLPWSAEKMHGRIKLLHDGREYELERKSGRTGVLQNAEVTDSITGLPVSEFSKSPGEAFLGVKKEVFERSAFIGQSSLAVDNDKSGELQSRIISLAGSGVETTSYRTTRERLIDWKNKRKYNKYGRIPELTEEKSHISQKLDKLRVDAKELTQKHTELEELILAEREHSRNAEIWQGIKAREQLELSELAKNAEDTARREYQAAVSKATIDGFLPDEVYINELTDKYNKYTTLNDVVLNDELIKNAERNLNYEKEKLRDFEMFRHMTPDAALEKANAAVAEHNRLQNSLKYQKRLRTICTVGSIALICLTAVCAFLMPGGSAYIIPAGVVASVLLFLIAVLMPGKKINSAKNAINELLITYRVSSIEEIISRAEDYREQISRTDEAQRISEQMQSDFMQKRERADALLRDILTAARKINHDAAPGDIPELIERVKREIKAVDIASKKLNSAEVRASSIAEGRDMAELIKEARLSSPEDSAPALSQDQVTLRLAEIKNTRRRLELDISAISARMETVGDIAALEAQERKISEELNEKHMEYEALECALSVLAEANGELQNRFAPELEKRAGRIFNMLTGGGFSIVKIKNTDMELAVSENAAATPRDILQLSAGTLDELYLSLRLALCEIALNPKIPIIIDDSLLTFDDMRMSSALDYLKAMSKNRQILLLSCHKREYEYFNNAEDVNLINLNY